MVDPIHPAIDRVLFSEEDIKECVARMGAQITKDYEGKELVVVSVLRGGSYFYG